MPAFLNVSNPDGCMITAIEYVHLAWTATILGVNFAYYELQRSDDGITWSDIAQITVEATVTFDDYESPRGKLVSYRIRTVRTDLAVSAWSAVITATADVQCCEMVFTTNWAPALNLAYNRGPELTLDFPDAAEVVFQRIYGRDYQVAFAPTERRGRHFAVPIIINSGDDPTTGEEGFGGFDSVRALATVDVPYICVMDHQGNKIQAQLNVGQGDYTEPFARYVAAIDVTEVTATPTAVTVP